MRYVDCSQAWHPPWGDGRCPAHQKQRSSDLGSAHAAQVIPRRRALGARTGSSCVSQRATEAAQRRHRRWRSRQRLRRCSSPQTLEMQGPTRNGIPVATKPRRYPHRRATSVPPPPSSVLERPLRLPAVGIVTTKARGHRHHEEGASPSHPPHRHARTRKPREFRPHE